MARLKDLDLFDLKKREIKADGLTIFKNINGKEGRNNLKEENNNLSASSMESILHQERFGLDSRKCQRATTARHCYAYLGRC